MWRILAVGLLLYGGSTSVQAADPSQVFDALLGIVKQGQELETQKQRQRQDAIRQLVRACRQLNETACLQIIDTKGMPAQANYTAFLHMGDIEYQRGERDAAHASYTYALKWAERTKRRTARVKHAKRKLAALAAEEEAAETVPVIEIPRSVPQPPPVIAAPQPPADPVCDDAQSVQWKIACLKASQDKVGAPLHAKLTDSLRRHRTTLRNLLQCEDDFEGDQQAVFKCYQDQGVSDQAVESTQLQVVDYDVVIGDHSPEEGN